MSFKSDSIYSSRGHFAWRSKDVCAILLERITGNIHVQLFKI